MSGLDGGHYTKQIPEQNKPTKNNESKRKNLLDNLLKKLFIVSSSMKLKFDSFESALLNYLIIYSCLPIKIKSLYNRP